MMPKIHDNKMPKNRRVPRVLKVLLGSAVGVLDLFVFICLWGLLGFTSLSLFFITSMVLLAGAFVAWRVRQQRHKRRQACLKQKRVNAPQLSEHQIYLMTKNTPAAQLEVLNDVLLVSLSLLHDCLSDIVIQDGTLFDGKFKKLLGLLKRINAKPELAMPTVSTVSRVNAIVIFAFYRLLYAGVLDDGIKQGVVAADTDKYVLLKRIPPKMMRYLGSQSWRVYELKTLIYGNLDELTLNADIKTTLCELCGEKPLLVHISNVSPTVQVGNTAPATIPASAPVPVKAVTPVKDIEIPTKQSMPESALMAFHNESKATDKPLEPGDLHKALTEQLSSELNIATPESIEPLVPGEILDLNDETSSSPVISSPKQPRQQPKDSHAQPPQAASEKDKKDKQHNTQAEQAPIVETETLVLDNVSAFERKFVSWLQRQVKRYEINKSERLFMDIQGFGNTTLFLNDVALSDFAKKDRIAIDQLRTKLGQLPMCVNKQFVLERSGLPNMFLYAMTIDFTVDVTNSLPGTLKEV